MCGIWCRCGRGSESDPQVFVKCLSPRGPECLRIETVARVTLGFTRLAINGLTPAGDQPVKVGTTMTICNGELYNYKTLAEKYNIALPDGVSDCYILPFLIQQLGAEGAANAIDGVFAFVHVNEDTNTITVGRDPYGVRPLFTGYDRDTNTYVWSSEIKAIPTTYAISPFPPGTIMEFQYDDFHVTRTKCVNYHPITIVKNPELCGLFKREESHVALRHALVDAVKKRLLSDRPIGALLSGGVDSSLIAAIAARELAKHGQKLHTFCIGMPGSTDLEFAQRVADKIGSVHHVVNATPEEFLAAIPQVIKDIESYDVTSVRASVGNWLIGKYIKENTDIKVVFNGDGSDEIGGGYIYNYAAPNDEEFELECVRLLKEIHVFDVLRSDRSMASHGLEARTPFLDKNVVAVWTSLDTRFRRPKHPSTEGRGGQMEKQILREAFDSERCLPWEVLWRKKEAFSDGVSSTADSWYKRCIQYAESKGFTEADLEAAKSQHNPPKTMEALLYRRIFESYYGEENATVIPHMWMPRWVATTNDPSARTLTELYKP